jgi:hypothetical protein
LYTRPSRTASLGILVRIDAFRALCQRLEHVDGSGQLALIDQRLSVLAADLDVVLVREEQRLGDPLHLPEVGLPAQQP